MYGINAGKKRSLLPTLNAQAVAYTLSYIQRPTQLYITLLSLYLLKKIRRMNRCPPTDSYRYTVKTVMSDVCDERPTCGVRPLQPNTS